MVVLNIYTGRKLPDEMNFIELNSCPRHLRIQHTHTQVVCVVSNSHVSGLQEQTASSAEPLGSDQLCML